MPQYLGNEETARVPTAFFQRALVLVDAAGRSDPEPALALLESLARIHGGPAVPTAAGFASQSCGFASQSAPTRQPSWRRWAC